MRDGTIEDFVAITVRPSGRALVLDKEHNWCDSNASYIDVFEDDEIPETAAKEFGLPVDYCIGIYHQFLEENPGYWDGSWEDEEEDEEMDESFKRKINRIVSECHKRNLH